MRGVCCDALNPRARPDYDKFWQLGETRLPGARLVLFDDLDFYGYYHHLVSHNVPVAVVLAGESIGEYDYAEAGRAYAKMLKKYPPAIWLIGNEPNAIRPVEDASRFYALREQDANPWSSWSMEPGDYAELWDGAVQAIKDELPDAECYVGGMLGSRSESMKWLSAVIDDVAVLPDGIDVHYPENEATFDAYRDTFDLELSCMEWNWSGRGVKTQDVVDFQKMIAYNTAHSAWFCWSSGQGVDYMGLISESGGKRKSYYDYQKALANLVY